MTKLVFRSGGRSPTNGRASLRKRELDVVIRVMLGYQGVGLKNQLTTRAGLAFELNMGMIRKRWNLLARRVQIFHSLSPRIVEMSPEIAGEPRLRDHPASLGASCNKLPSNQGNIRKYVTGLQENGGDDTGKWKWSMVDPSWSISLIGSDPLHWRLSSEVFRRQCSRVH